MKIKVRIEVWIDSPQTQSEWLSQVIKKEFEVKNIRELRKKIVDWLTMWKTKGDYSLSTFYVSVVGKILNKIIVGNSWVIKGIEIQPDGDTLSVVPKEENQNG